MPRIAISIPVLAGDANSNAAPQLSPIGEGVTRGWQVVDLASRKIGTNRDAGIYLRTDACFESGPKCRSDPTESFALSLAQKLLSNSPVLLSIAEVFIWKLD